jgi:hypothetical protein
MSFRGRISFFWYRPVDAAGKRLPVIAAVASTLIV